MARTGRKAKQAPAPGPRLVERNLSASGYHARCGKCKGAAAFSNAELGKLCEDLSAHHAAAHKDEGVAIDIAWKGVLAFTMNEAAQPAP